MDMATVDEGVSAYQAGAFDDARKIWEPLAEAGDADAQAWMGALYANGEGVESDRSVAFAWYLRSAENGNVLAMNNVGAMYAQGQGVSKDETAAAQWLEKAAEAGDSYAQFNFAVMLTKGQGVEQDVAAAAEWYRRASENGHYPSQSRLGYMYAKGLGVEQDNIQAFVWLSLAGQHGIGTALVELEELVKDMTPQEKAQAVDAMNAWRARTAGVAGPSRLEPLPA
ncbi:MAG: hypothetical protein CMM50_16910 [Rhodospirillaceae bacterium]|nr:hypothetical protein [Rhodospirillaceae bacterium]|tara:strand:- start:7 stop:681 length:675 start_codon:yes stop_codon:yes gene_type:complete